MPPPELKTALTRHLEDWGLRRFDSDAAYDQWQRDRLSRDDLKTLARLAEERHSGDAAETAFYDYAAQPHILPVLYSQRYEYYLHAGPAVAERIGEARSALDVGCGIGVLTTFYARHFPRCSFVGIDRSSASVAVAQERAASLGLANVRFECLDADRTALPGPFDRVMAAHALLQTETDPGIPSRNWQTFERARDPAIQADFERRTGLAVRLDRLCASLAPDGRLIVFEKTRHLARKVPFQRALAAQGLALREPPLPIRYLLVEEVTDDGPLYVLGRELGQAGVAWDESPEGEAADILNLATLKFKAVAKDEPLYENHLASAQRVWSQLPGRQVLQETTRQEPDGRQVHVEVGTTQGLTYLYCANTFDQRQLVIADAQRAGLLTRYYQELVQGLDVPGR